MFIELIYGIIKFIFLQFYPCFITFKAIRLEKATDYVSLLTFWVVSVLFLSVEYFADFFLFWLPFYTEFKLLFLIWLILPQTQGTAVFYSKYVEPFFEHHQSGIEHTLIRFQQSLKTMVFSWLQRFLPSQILGSPQEEQEEKVANPYSIFRYSFEKPILDNPSSITSYLSSWIWTGENKQD